MAELQELLERATLSNVISFILDDDSTGNMIEDYEKSIQDAFKICYSKLEELCKKNCGNSNFDFSVDNNEMFDIIADFSGVIEQIYFEVGLLCKVQLLKDTKSYLSVIDKIDKNDIDNERKKYVIECLKKGRIDDDAYYEFVKDDPKLKEINHRINEKLDHFKNLLQENNKSLFDEIILDHNLRTLFYIEFIYKMGVNDGLALR